MEITAYDVASRFVGIGELPGEKDNPFILAMLQLDNKWPEHDEVPWCSAFVNFVAMILGLPRSKSLAARSWMTVGEEVKTLAEARRGFDIVVLSRTSNPAQGHVGFFFSYTPDTVSILGGNQGNKVSHDVFPASRVVAIRRLWSPG